MGLYEYHIVHLAIFSDALKVASSNGKLCSYLLRGLWKSTVNIAVSYTHLDVYKRQAEQCVE